MSKFGTGLCKTIKDYNIFYNKITSVKKKRNLVALVHKSIKANMSSGYSPNRCFNLSIVNGDSLDCIWCVYGPANRKKAKDFYTNLKYSNIVVGDLNGIINKSKDIKIPSNQFFSLSKFMAENNLNDMFDRKSEKSRIDHILVDSSDKISDYRILKRDIALSPDHCMVVSSINGQSPNNDNITPNTSEINKIKTVSENTTNHVFDDYSTFIQNLNNCINTHSLQDCPEPTPNNYVNILLTKFRKWVSFNCKTENLTAKYPRYLIT
eukprot:TRINITY_DN3296_c0_g1_i3.p1 TRINITY_DN3296_c0_g1~~TRINITY_DN3296_c0_g1_i3.p1  ORF type:complete len:265 (+),score=22.24 TRINITY_DN3296_c0_g1_i3:392-1186(+)